MQSYEIDSNSSRWPVGIRCCGCAEPSTAVGQLDPSPIDSAPLCPRCLNAEHERDVESRLRFDSASSLARDLLASLYAGNGDILEIGPGFARGVYAHLLSLSVAIVDLEAERLQSLRSEARVRVEAP